MTKIKWAEYPRALHQETGCKVGWRFYSDRKLAEACAKAAKNNALIQVAAGYDFGYCSPGSIETVADLGLVTTYRVCIP
jgi:hypothetical protein